LGIGEYRKSTADKTPSVISPGQLSPPARLDIRKSGTEKVLNFPYLFGDLRMKTQHSIFQNLESLGAPVSPTSAEHFPPLEHISRPTVTTEEAAYYLNRKPQTMRAWACLENGALRPLRICGRLAWKVADIKSLLEGGAK